MSNKKSIALKRAARIGRRLIHPFYSDRAFLTNRFTKMKGVAPNLDNPETFSEKLLYLNLHYRNPLETLCADKYYVAEYVRACGLDHILKKNYGVYQLATQIDFDALPDEFFIKCNHLSGNNMIVRKSEKPDYEYIRRFYAEMLKMNFYYFHREYCYKAIRPLIICEECLKDSKGNLPVDYKFYCFDGEPKYFMVSYGEYEHKVRNHKFDMELNSVDYHFKKESTLPQEEVVLPENFEELVSVVKKLCKPFPHVRVDMYDVDGRIVFGELTFSSNGGVVNVYDKEYDKVIGSWIPLEKYRIDMR